LALPRSERSRHRAREMSSSGSWERDVAELYDGLASYYAHDNRVEVRQVYLGLLADLSGGRVYEAGCGAGQDTEALARAGFDVVAVDLSPKMVALARQRTIGCSNAHVVLGDSESVGGEFAPFDVVLSSMEIVHHQDLGRAINRYARFLKPGGRLVLVSNHPVRNMFTDPNHDYFNEGCVEESWGVIGTVPKYRWTLESYFTALRGANLWIEGVRECRAPIDVQTVQDHSVAFDGSYPSFLILYAQKAS
jgi:SAM-dependent methyltransferase